MDIVNPNYLNYMEQIQKNRKDIENLYEQELRDITQLNFKENDVNGLQYTNGKAIFNGKSTIIRDESIENLEVDSKVELKISSNDNNIVIGAGEDNSTLEIHLDNGTITTLDFAESERQKSKNLLLVVDSSATRYGYTMTCKDGVFSINGGNGTDESTFILSGTGGVKLAPTKYYQSIILDNTNSIKLSAGTYTISATIPSSQMGIIYGDLGTTSQSGASSRSLSTNITLTFTKTTYVCVYRYLTGSAMTNVSLGSLQLEEGSVATDYQPYNGAIVHEKQIADVEHIETIYDMSSSDSNINKGYTSGLQFSGTTGYNIMEQPQKNKYKCFRATAHLVNTDLIFEFMNNVDGYARGGFSCQAQWLDASQICAGNISIAPWGKIPLSNCIIQSGSTVTSKMDDTSYYISKIEGVLL